MVKGPYHGYQTLDDLMGMVASAWTEHANEHLPVLVTHEGVVRGIESLKYDPELRAFVLETD